MTQTLGRRIAMARVGSKKTVQAVADILGKAKSTVSHWENDKSEPSLTDLEKLSAALCVNQNWLTFGEGPIFQAAEQPTAPAQAQ